MLERVYIAAKRPKMIVFDPPSNFLGKTDEHKNAEVRSVVMKLVAWLDSKGVAAVFLTHVNRRLEKGVEALDRIMGSVAWGTTARIAVGFAGDPDDPAQCLMAGIKNNLGPKAPTLAYQIAPTNDLASIEWKGVVDISADEALNKVKKKSRAQNAAEWLMERFRERRCWPSDELYALGRTEAISRNAIWEAQDSLPLRRERIKPPDGGHPFWQWTAHPGWPPEKQLEPLERLEPLASNSNGSNDLPSVPDNDSGLERLERLDDWVRDQRYQSSQNDENAGTLNNPMSGKHLSGKRSKGSKGLDGENSTQFPRPEGWEDDWIYFDGSNKEGGKAS